MSQGPAAGAPPHEDVLSADGPPEPQGSPAAGIGDSSATEEWRRPGHSDATQIALHALVVIGIGVAVLALLVLGVRAATQFSDRYDTFWYHLPFAAELAGIDLSYEMTETAATRLQGFPVLPELIMGILWRLAGTVNATSVVNYLAFALFLAYCHVALRARFWLVALIALTAPLVVIHLTSTYVDLFANAFLAMGAASCLFAHLNPDRVTRWVIIGGFVGPVLAAWSKFQLVPLVGLFLVLFAAILALAPRPVRLRHGWLLGLMLVAALVASGPYIKNLALHGNPFWPSRVPVIGDLMPYAEDNVTSGAESERGRNLAGAPQPLVFVHSLLEIDHPDSYPDRPRWTIDQGNAWIAFRMGGFWNVGVLVYLLTAGAMLVGLKGRRGVVAAAGSVAVLALVSVLPQSNELRYYMFIPLTWAATIAMLFPGLRAAYPKAAVGLLGMVLALFGIMVAENRTYYEIKPAGWLEAAQNWNAAGWWPAFERGQTYCVVGMVPRGFLMTGPTGTEYRIIEREDVANCPPDVTIVTQEGIQPR